MSWEQAVVRVTRLMLGISKYQLIMFVGEARLGTPATKRASAALSLPLINYHSAGRKCDLIREKSVPA